MSDRLLNWLLKLTRAIWFLSCDLALELKVPYSARRHSGVTALVLYAGLAVRSPGRLFNPLKCRGYPQIQSPPDSSPLSEVDFDPSPRRLLVGMTALPPASGSP